MISAFYKQIAPCGRHSLPVRPPPVATRASSPRSPRVGASQDVPARKLEHETQAAFLKALIAFEDGEESRQLRDGLAKADRERKCIRQAILLMVAIFILSLAGLSYCALLLPQTVFKTWHFATLSLTVLGLAALIAQLEFFGYLLWHRSGVNRLHKECRRRVLALVESQLSASLRPGPGVAAPQEQEAVNTE